jgi:hypothetical protein
VEFDSGYHFHTQESIVAEQEEEWSDEDEAKSMDLTQCAYYVTTGDGNGPYGIDTLADLNQLFFDVREHD